MAYKNRYYVFNCYNCGALYYTRKRIKRKKCLRCGKSFSFEKSKKVKVKLKEKEMIELIKFLKEKKYKSNKFSLNEEIRKLRR
jgi:predicted  nucleic acid-binding Zn-ribbon protein